MAPSLSSAVDFARQTKRHWERVVQKRLHRSSYFRQWLRGRLRASIRGAGPLRVIVGGGHYLPYRGWRLTDQDILDITDPESWRALFGDRRVDNLLAEHVWEHLTIEDGFRAAKLAFEYLRPGGVLRIAVPDGAHPNPRYLDAVRPGGSGKAAMDHQVLLTYASVGDLLARAGFEVRLLEYWDERGTFHHQPWSYEPNGRINRRPSFSPDAPAFVRGRDYAERQAQSAGHPANYPFNYTSLIVDAIKSE